MSYLYDSHYSTNSTEFLAIYFPFIVQYYLSKEAAQPQ